MTLILQLNLGFGWGQPAAARTATLRYGATSAQTMYGSTLRPTTQYGATSAQTQYGGTIQAVES